MDTPSIGVYDWQREGLFVEPDERWIGDWCEFGMRELCASLAKHAAFDRYCKENNR